MLLSSVNLHLPCSFLVLFVSILSIVSHYPVFVFGSQEISLETSLVSCHNEEAINSLLLKNPVRLATTMKGHSAELEKLNKAYSKCRKMLLITLRIAESSNNFVSDALVVVDQGRNTLTHRPSRFGNPIAVKFHQDKIVQKYSLKYLYRVNGKMWEEVLNHENQKNYTGCDDEGVSPTCGFITAIEDKTSTKEVAGFCCSCDDDHKDNVQQRGGQRCDTPGIEPDLLSSAHCLRSGPFSYNVYEVGPPTLYQKVSFEVFISGEKADGSLTWKKLSDTKDGIVVDSLNPVMASGPMKVTYRPHLEKIDESTVLLKQEVHPRLLYPNPNPYVSKTAMPEPLQGPMEDQIIIVPKSLMAPHGAKCDHVGTGPDAFLSQTNPCRMERSSCLKNQPFDLWKMDQGPHGDESKKYRLKSYAPTTSSNPDDLGGTPPFVEFSEDLKIGSLFIEHKATAPTYVDIEFPADDILLLSPGYNALIESVLTDTGSDGAKIVVQVLNREYVGASFSIKLVQCTLDDTSGNGGGGGNGVPTTSKSKWIDPLGATHFSIDLHPYQIPQTVYCFVVLINEFGEQIAAREIILEPRETCLCVHTCKCACGNGENVKCETLSDENMIATGLFDEVKSLEEQGRGDDKHHNRFDKVFNWILLFHLGLVLFGGCVWIVKCCCKGKNDDDKQKVKSKFTLDDDEEEEEEEGMQDDDDDHLSVASEVTLYKRDGATASSAPSLIDQARRQSGEASSGSGVSKVTFVDDVFSLNPSRSQKNRNATESGRSLHEVMMNDDSFSLTKTAPSSSNVRENDITRSGSKLGPSQSSAEQGGAFSKGNFSKSEANNGEGGGGQSARFADSLENADGAGGGSIEYDTDNNVNAFMQLLSASSSKASLGTWNRRKRDQFTAYDFLPAPKRKDS